MAHFWQALRSGNLLTAARMRGNSLILLVAGALALTTSGRYRSR